MATRRRRSGHGFALPLVLFVIALATVLGAALLTMSAAEQRIVSATALQSDAYTIARGGIERFLVERIRLGFTRVPPAPVESTRLTFPDGYADVVLTELRAEQGTEPALYVLRSRGMRLDRGSPRRPLAERTIAQYARWQNATMQVRAAWASLQGIAWRNSAGALEGSDACGAAATVAGVAVPDAPGFQQGPGKVVPNGAPNQLLLGPPLLAPDSIAVNWARIRAGGLVAGEVAIPGSAWPTAASWNDPNFWPVVVVQGNFTLPTDGRGLLVVTGNLRLSGGRGWDGVVLVGGTVIEQGGNRVFGTLLSGLDRKLGVPAAAMDTVQGAMTVRYHSCHIKRALDAFRGLSAYRNATVDHWP